MAKAVLEAHIESNTGEVAKGMEDVAKKTEDVDKAAKKAEGGVKRLSVGFKNLMKATGIVALLSKAFEVLQEVFMSNQKVVDTFNTAMEALKIVFNDLFKVITDNVEPIKAAFKALFEDPKQAISDFSDAIQEGFIKRFEQAGDVVSRLGNAVSKVFGGDFKGAFEDVKQAGVEAVDVITGQDDSLKNITETVTEYTKKVVDNAKAQIAANKAAQFAELEVRKLQAENLKLAEDERQIRDNVNLTFKERIEANERLSKILETQQEAQKKALQTEIDALALAVETNASDENKLALMAKEIEMLELEEAINGQRAEQLTNQVALENELRDAKVQTSLAGMDAREREMAELKASYDEQVRLAKQAGVATTAIAKQNAKDQKRIKKDQVNSEISAAGDLAGALSSLAGDNKELAAASAIISTYAGANKAFEQGGTLGFISAAAIIVQGLANVKRIYATDVGSGGGGGGVGGGSQPAPQMMSGEFNLSGGVEPEPVKAFVVTDEMSNSQNQLANIRRRATI